MRRVIVSLLCILGKFLFSLRYKIEVKGLKEAKKVKGALFLPNHPSLTDPILLAIFLWPKFRIKPLVVEYIYRQSGIHMVMKIIQALPIPNLDTSLNEIKLKKAKEVIQKIIQGLHKKDNFLLYPSGRLKQTGKEIIGGASATHTILQGAPDAKVFLIRTTGLWGSSFSRAFEEKSPDFKKTVMNNIKYILKNGFFFMPRRKVLIEIEPAPADFPMHSARITLNRYLEDWYNRYPLEDGIVDKEPLNLVSYRWWSKKVQSPTKRGKTKTELSSKEFSSKVEEQIFSKLAALSTTSVGKITQEMDLATDLGLDSLDMAELIAFLGVHFDIGEVHPQDIVIVRDLLEIAGGRKKREAKEEIKELVTWPDEKQRVSSELPTGKTIPEAFLRICDRMGDAPAIADDMLGVLSYKKLKLAVLALMPEMKKIPGKNVGILLPASAGTYMIIFALLLAKKVPVMMNWTLGARYLNHMAELTDVKKVISSWKFLEKITNVEFGKLANNLLLLEDITKKIGIKQKIVAFMRSLKKAHPLLKTLKLHKCSEEERAVILFTSGTEAHPKGVPLSHKNILSNQREAMQCVPLKTKDVLYGVLPPFHSFGFSVAGIFPILAGVKIAFYPDPTDSHALAQGIKRWKISLLCLAPSFLKGILQAAKKEDLVSVRLFVTGAEKASKELFTQVKHLGKKAQLIEGYGITECSPILTINRPNLPSKGVGQLLPDTDFCTIDPETHVLLPSGEEGEICVAGPSVFSGYLGNQKSPFITINGKKWYMTGDLGYIDERGYVTLSGRLKRFVKIGGEMISLRGIEEVLSQELHAQNADHTIALSAKEEEGGRPELVLFTTFAIDKDSINKILQNKGFSRLVKINHIRHIDEIPLMGTGKVDYRYLQKLAQTE